MIFKQGATGQDAPEEITRKNENPHTKVPSTWLSGDISADLFRIV